MRSIQNMYKKKIIIEGSKDIVEVLDTFEIKIKNIFYHKKTLKLKKFEFFKQKLFEKNISFTEISNKKFKELRKTVNSEGLFAEIEITVSELEDVIKKNIFILALDSVQDPGNVGTIIRTGAVLGLDGVLLSENCAKISNPKVLRAVKGFISDISIVENVCLKDALLKLKNKNFKILIADSKGKNISNVKFTKPLCLLFGSEGQGVSKEFLSIGEKISIPTKKQFQSLNVAIASGIIINEVLKSWK